MLMLVVLWAVFYGWLLNRLTKLSWEWGITQSWNSIPHVKEAPPARHPVAPRRAPPPPHATARNRRRSSTMESCKKT